jgi:RNA polymerase sigma-70 factor (ECF subfamily)
MVGSREDAEDCAQTAFIKAYSALSTYRAGSPFKRWIYRIAANVCVDLLRRSKVRPSVPFEEIHTELSERRPDPGQAATVSELREAVRAALSRLDDKYRLPLTLFHLEGLEYSEISSMLRLRMGTVKIRIRRGRLMLREIIAKEWPEVIL